MPVGTHQEGAKDLWYPESCFGGIELAAEIHGLCEQSFDAILAEYQQFLEKRGDELVAQEPTYEHPRVITLTSGRTPGRYTVLTNNPNAGLNVAVYKESIVVQPFGDDINPVITYKDVNGVPTVPGMYRYAMEVEKEYHVSGNTALEVALLGNDSTPSQRINITAIDAFKDDASDEDRPRGMITLGGSPDTKDELGVLGIIKINYADESRPA